MFMSQSRMNMPSQLASVLTELGCGQSVDNRWGIPLHFGSLVDEYWAARRGAGLIDLSALGKIQVTGRDRARFLNGLCTNDVKGLAAGEGCEAFFTNVQGKILFCTRIFAEAESLWVDTVPGVVNALMVHLDRYHVMEKVEFADRTAEFAQIALIGPRAREELEQVSGTVVDLARLGHAEITLAGSVCRQISSDQLALPTFELRVPASQAETVWRELWRQGEVRGVRPLGAAAFEVLRIEAGFPLAGVDVDDSNLPQEIGRDRLSISFTKGCYLGQETIARIDAMGHVNRHLVGLDLPGISSAIPGGVPIVAQDKRIGHVTSSAVSPRCNHTIALGYVRREYNKPGTAVSVVSDSQAIPAAITSLPFGG